uniref:Secreted protein n=1 Tax=Sipha flava TaxID=143950 RepID=A0A2S2PY60_9HEMI
MKIIKIIIIVIIIYPCDETVLVAVAGRCCRCGDEGDGQGVAAWQRRWSNVSQGWCAVRMRAGLASLLTNAIPGCTNALPVLWPPPLVIRAFEVASFSCRVTVATTYRIDSSACTPPPPQQKTTHNASDVYDNSDFEIDRKHDDGDYGRDEKRSTGR